MLYISPSYEKIWGKTCESLYKHPRSWMDSIHPDDRTKIFKIAKRDYPGYNLNVIYRIIRPDGTLRWIRDRNFPIRDKSGRPYRAVGFAEDITELKLAEESLAYSRGIIEAQEAERRRVARELHDGVSQILSSIQLRAHSIDEQIAGVAPGVSNHLKRCTSLLGQARAEIRRISHNLRPSLLDDLGLAPAIASDCEDFKERTGRAVRFRHSGLAARLPHDLELALYRITQEALSNIEKHSGADRVFLRLLRKNGHILMSVRDNGKGFDPLHRKRKISGRSGSGLAIMAERAAAVGGEVTVLSYPGQGTQVAVEIPLAHAN